MPDPLLLHTPQGYPHLYHVPPCDHLHLTWSCSVQMFSSRVLSGPREGREVEGRGEEEVPKEALLRRGEVEEEVVGL